MKPRATLSAADVRARLAAGDRLAGAEVESVDLSGLEAERGASFSGARFWRVDLRGAKLASTEWLGAKLE
ncbi:MAG TPA: pentapeptide repeat-containing protein, partial [Byssovorax sp.]